MKPSIEQQLATEENERILQERDDELWRQYEEAERQGVMARRNNAAQPKGKWDAGSQTWAPAVDPTHGKASRKWNPGGVSQWNQAALQQRANNIGQMLANEEMAQDQMWGEFSSVMNAMKKKRAETALAKQSASASLMRAAMENGGAIPDEVIALYNRMFGYDGQTSGLVSGSGFMKDGSFNMRMIGGADANGNPLVQDVKADLPTQFVMMNRNRRVFGQDAVFALAGKLKEVGYSPREIESLAYMGGGGQTIDAYRAKGGFGDGSAGGRNIGGVTARGGTARRLFGMGGDNRSRISFFGTGGAGTGYTTREYNGHTGEDTGFVNHEQRREEELNREADRQERINKARQRTGYGRTFDEQMALEDRRIAARKESEEARNNIRLKEIRSRQLSRLDKEKAAARKAFLEQHSPVEYRDAAKAEGGSDAQVYARMNSMLQAAADEYVNKMFAAREAELNEDWKGVGEDQQANKKPSSDGQAASSKVDNSGSEKWGSLTPEQIKRVKAKGGTYDEKTGEIVLPNGKRMKV